MTALKSDPATACVRITSVYEVIEAGRSGGDGSKVTCGAIVIEQGNSLPVVVPPLTLGTPLQLHSLP